MEIIGIFIILTAVLWNIVDMVWGEFFERPRTNSTR